MKLITQQSQGWVFIHQLDSDELDHYRNMSDWTLTFRYPGDTITVICPWEVNVYAGDRSMTLPSWFIGA